MPPRLQLSNSGKHQDLHCPFGFESQLELRLSQKKLKRKKQEEKAQRREAKHLLKTLDAILDLHSDEAGAEFLNSG